MASDPELVKEAVFAFLKQGQTPSCVGYQPSRHGDCCWMSLSQRADGLAINQSIYKKREPDTDYRGEEIQAGSCLCHLAVSVRAIHAIVHQGVGTQAENSTLVYLENINVQISHG